MENSVSSLFILVLMQAQLVKPADILNTTIAVSPKPSFLLNERIYTKLSGERDQLWAISALEAVGRSALLQIGSAWSLAAIYFITNPKLSKTVRDAAQTMLTKVLIVWSKNVGVIITGMEEWLRQVHQVKSITLKLQISEERRETTVTTDKDSSLELLRNVATAILPKTLLSETPYVSHVLVRLFVLAHHPMLPSHQWSWIDMTRRANIDPGQLATDRMDKFMEVVSEKMWPVEKVPPR
jgi:hypothetical protein